MGCGNFNNYNLLNAKIDFSSLSPIKGETLNFSGIDTMFFQMCGYDTNTPEKNSEINITFSKNIKVISNRTYTVWLSFFDNNKFFRKFNNQNFNNENVVKLNPVIVESDTNNNINIINETYYKQPVMLNNGVDVLNRTYFDETQPDLIKQEYFGSWTYDIVDVDETQGEVTVDRTFGTGVWRRLKCEFKLNDNSGSALVKLGVNIKTSDQDGFNVGQFLLFNNFAYEAADTLTQDPSNEDDFIRSNFDDSFRGGIQKLRIYDRALTSQETLHNAVIEAKLNPSIAASKGGRIINVFTPKVVIPKPQPVVVRDIMVFYGSMETQPITNQNLVDNTTTLNMFVSDAVANDIITINFGDKFGKYLWFAIPSKFTQKTIWEVRGVHRLKGGIGESSDLFIINGNIPISSVEGDFTDLNYDFYITQYPTDTSSGNEFNFKP